MDLDMLSNKGWIEVGDITSPRDLITIGNKLGTIIPGPNGEIIKEIKRKNKEDSFQGSQSSIYGHGRFPLHTDTVFWPLPSRYVIFYAVGDVRRPTTFMKFSNLIPQSRSSFYKLAQKSIWYVGPNTNRFYCSMVFKYDGNYYWRYDSDLMTPVNSAAIEINEILKPLVFTTETEYVNWSGSNAVIISNWTILHGRGAQPQNEAERIIYRLYIK
jgi:hypothetical protein